MLKKNIAFCETVGLPRILLLLCLAFLPVTVVASVPVRVTQAEFSTYERLQYPTEPADPSPVMTNGRSLVANAPFSDYFQAYDRGYTPTGGWLDPYHLYYGGATSSWFHVSVTTRAQSGQAYAYAISDVTFSPLFDDVANITLELSGSLLTWSEGFASLRDVTLDRGLWCYEWAWGGTLPLGGGGRPEPYLTYDTSGGLPWWLGPFSTPDTALTYGHEYQLVMYTQTVANGDREQAAFNALGIEIIPEPSAIALIGLGTTALLLARRRR
jgi:hypothetical protein